MITVVDTWCFYVVPLAGRQVDEAFSDSIFRVADELIDLEASNDALLDSSLAATLEDDGATVEITLTVRAETFVDAEAQADSALRAAIHAAGGFTPGWRRRHIDDRTDDDAAAKYDVRERSAKLVCA